LAPVAVEELREHFAASARQANAKSSQLAHTQILQPQQDDRLRALSASVAPRIAEFGELLFGERLEWSIKEMWLNVLEAGGQQALHSHANSFISGVLYLTPCHPQASLVFVKAMGQPAFVFKNTHQQSATGPFNADKWVMPATAAGDLVLFPSYLLHEVPVNPGDRRVSLAFNAIPNRLDAWGYRVGFTQP
jgi:uncharacterized protein (TIGR02466 family)